MVVLLETVHCYWEVVPNSQVADQVPLCTCSHLDSSMSRILESVCIAKKEVNDWNRVDVLVVVATV